MIIENSCDILCISFGSIYVKHIKIIGNINKN